MGNAASQVDGFIRKHKTWSAELTALRAILLDCGLTETIKWRQPCYTQDGGNVVILSAMKDAATLSFLKGALLKDAKGILEKPGENSQSARYLKFADIDAIKKRQRTVKAYLKEAIAIEKAGLKVDFKAKHELVYPDELIAKLDANAKLKAAFEALTPGRQRGYVMHFAGAKQSKTRASRIDKCTPAILAGKGLHDR